MMSRERERLAFVREVHGRTIIKLDLELLPEVPLSLTAKFVSLPDLGLAVGSFTPLRGTLTSQLVDSNDIILNITLSGGRIVEQRGRRVSIGPGEAVATTSTDPGVVTVHSASDFISLRVARKTLQPMVGNLDACLARTISARNDALGLLTGYAGLINEFDALAKPDIARLVATHFHDLISITLGADARRRRDSARPGPPLSHDCAASRNTSCRTSRAAISRSAPQLRRTALRPVTCECCSPANKPPSPISS